MGKTKRKSEVTHKPKIQNQRVFELVHERSLLTGENEKDIYKLIGVSQTNLTPLRSGKSSFTVDQLIAAANIFNISLDWICGRIDSRLSVSAPIRPELEAFIENKIKELIKK